MAPKASLAKLRLFRRHPELLNSDEYAIKSDVCQDVLDLFLGRLDGVDVSERVTVENAAQLGALSDELGFSGFDAEIEAALGDSREVRGDSSCLVDRVKGLESVVAKQQRLIDSLYRKVGVRRGRKDGREVGRKDGRMAVRRTRMPEDAKVNAVEQNAGKSSDVVLPSEGAAELNVCEGREGQASERDVEPKVNQGAASQVCCDCGEDGKSLCGVRLRRGHPGGRSGQGGSRVL